MMFIYIYPNRTFPLIPAMLPFSVAAKAHRIRPDTP